MCALALTPPIDFAGNSGIFQLSVSRSQRVSRRHCQDRSHRGGSEVADTTSNITSLRCSSTLRTALAADVLDSGPGRRDAGREVAPGMCRVQGPSAARYAGCVLRHCLLCRARPGTLFHLATQTQQIHFLLAFSLRSRITSFLMKYMSLCLNPVFATRLKHWFTVPSDKFKRFFHIHRRYKVEQ